MKSEQEAVLLAGQLSFADIAFIFYEKVLSLLPPLPSSGPLFDFVNSFYQIPVYHLVLEAALVFSIIWMLFIKSYRLDAKKEAKIKLSEKEIDELVREWQPEPLVPLDSPPPHPTPIIESKVAPYVQIKGQKTMNLSSFNFLGFIGNKDVEEAAIKTLHKYGVGSCGPRGFYGTIDVHLDLEAKLAKFTGTEEAVLYSYAFSTVASIIPAYAKRGDVLFVDEGISFPLYQGVVASRSNVKYFKHNNMDDLERLLQEQQREDQKNPKKAKITRRFVVVEGLYANSGDIVPLKRLVDLKWKYKVRIMLDETFSFGVLGASGKGVTEHAGVNIDDIDILSSSLEHAVGSIGGFAYGKTYVVDHQRLSSQGYCFSASLPPLLASAAIAALDSMEGNPAMFTELREKSSLMHAALEKSCGQWLNVAGDSISPLIFLTPKKSVNREHDDQKLDSVVEKALAQGFALTRARFIEDLEAFPKPASIRVSVCVAHSKKELEDAAKAIGAAVQEVFAE